MICTGYYDSENRWISNNSCDLIYNHSRESHTFSTFNSLLGHYVHYSRRYGNPFFASASLYEHRSYWIFATDDVSVFDFWKECFIVTIREEVTSNDPFFIAATTCYRILGRIMIEDSRWDILCVVIWNSKKETHTHIMLHKRHKNKVKINVCNFSTILKKKARIYRTNILFL